MARKWRNNGFSSLAAALGANPSTDTTLSVQASHGDRFPAVSGSDFFLLSLQDAAGNIEIVKVTARTLGADTMTIVRGQEATVPRAWNINDIVELRLTAGALEDMVSLTENQTVTGDMEFDGSATFDGAVTFNSTVTGVTAAQTSYDNTASGLAATDVKAALDELDGDITALSFQADAISYDPTGSTLVATDVQAAIDELASAPSDKLVTANWTVEQSGSDLVFKYGSSTVFKITSTGAIVAANDITAFGSP